MQKRGDFVRKIYQKPQNQDIRVQPDFVQKSHFPPISPRKNVDFEGVIREKNRKIKERYRKVLTINVKMCIIYKKGNTYYRRVLWF